MFIVRCKYRIYPHDDQHDHDDILEQFDNYEDAKKEYDTINELNINNGVFVLVQLIETRILEEMTA